MAVELDMKIRVSCGAEDGKSKLDLGGTSQSELSETVGNILSKIGSIALTSVLTLLSGVASDAANTVALTCSEIVVSAGTKEPALNQSLIVDLDRGIVTIGSIGELPIVKVTETSVSFKGNLMDGQTVWKGDVDRFSGLRF